MTKPQNGKHEAVVECVYNYLRKTHPGSINKHVEYYKRNGNLKGEIDILRLYNKEVHNYEIKSSHNPKLRSHAYNQIYRYADYIKAYYRDIEYIGWLCIPENSKETILLEPIIQITNGLETILSDLNRIAIKNNYMLSECWHKSAFKEQINNMVIYNLGKESINGYINIGCDKCNGYEDVCEYYIKNESEL